jgi:hypothetical protein
MLPPLLPQLLLPPSMRAETSLGTPDNTSSHLSLLPQLLLLHQLTHRNRQTKS